MPPNRIPFALADMFDEIERLCPDGKIGPVLIFLDRPTFDIVAGELKDRFGLPIRGVIDGYGEVERVPMRVFFSVCCKVGDG